MANDCLSNDLRSTNLIVDQQFCTTKTAVQRLDETKCNYVKSDKQLDEKLDCLANLKSLINEKSINLKATYLNSISLDKNSNQLQKSKEESLLNSLFNSEFNRPLTSIILTNNLNKKFNSNQSNQFVIKNKQQPPHCKRKQSSAREEKKQSSEINLETQLKLLICIDHNSSSDQNSLDDSNFKPTFSSSSNSSEAGPSSSNCSRPSSICSSPISPSILQHQKTKSTTDNNGRLQIAKKVSANNKSILSTSIQTVNSKLPSFVSKTSKVLTSKLTSKVCSKVNCKLNSKSSSSIKTSSSSSSLKDKLTPLINKSIQASNTSTTAIQNQFNHNNSNLSNAKDVNFKEEVEKDRNDKIINAKDMNSNDDINKNLNNSIINNAIDAQPVSIDRNQIKQLVNAAQNLPTSSSPVEAAVLRFSIIDDPIVSISKCTTTTNQLNSFKNKFKNENEFREKEEDLRLSENELRKEGKKECLLKDHEFKNLTKKKDECSIMTTNFTCTTSEDTAKPKLDSKKKSKNDNEIDNQYANHQTINDKNGEQLNELAKLNKLSGEDRKEQQNKDKKLNELNELNAKELNNDLNKIVSRSKSDVGHRKTTIQNRFKPESDLERVFNTIGLDIAHKQNNLITTSYGTSPFLNSSLSNSYKDNFKDYTPIYQSSSFQNRLSKQNSIQFNSIHNCSGHYSNSQLYCNQSTVDSYYTLDSSQKLMMSPASKTDKLDRAEEETKMSLNYKSSEPIYFKETKSNQLLNLSRSFNSVQLNEFKSSTNLIANIDPNLINCLNSISLPNKPAILNSKLIKSSTNLKNLPIKSLIPENDLDNGEISIIERNARVIKWLYNCKKYYENLSD